MKFSYFGASVFIFVFLGIASNHYCFSLTVPRQQQQPQQEKRFKINTISSVRSSRIFSSNHDDDLILLQTLKNDYHRRSFFQTVLSTSSLIYTGPVAVGGAWAASTSTSGAETKSTSNAVVTDRISLSIKGLSPVENGENDVNDNNNDQIVIGLFGNDAPQPVSVLKQLASKKGLPARCKTREERALQREQLEANKVYNACKEGEGSGVTYIYSQIWKISKDKRIDFGSVSGRYIAREFPNFSDGGIDNGLRHDAFGVVSVRRGNEGGFGFTIYPGNGLVTNNEMDEENIVIGRVEKGMDIVAKLNDFPVFRSSQLNYKALTGTKSQNAPSRACRYGGAMYCNELKPLKKLTLSSVDIL